MSEKTLYERGAECVAGDLILNRKVVGRYRNGQFILTAEGVDELENVVEVQAVEVAEPSAKAPKPRKPRVTPSTPEQTAAPEPDVEDLLANLGE